MCLGKEERATYRLAGCSAPFNGGFCHHFHQTLHRHQRLCSFMMHYVQLISRSFITFFDFSFKRRATITEFIPVLYLCLLMGSIGVIIHVVWSAYDDSLLRGRLYLAASPLIFFVLAVISRILLEFFMLISHVAHNIRVISGMNAAISQISADTQSIAAMGRSLDEISFDIKAIAGMKGSLNQIAKVVEHIETIAEMSVSIEKISALGENVELITMVQKSIQSIADLGEHIEAIAAMRYSLEKISALTDNIEAIAKMSEALDKISEIGDVVARLKRVPFMR